jgi:hypothetical protein
MGSQKCGIVGKSQLVLIMINRGHAGHKFRDRTWGEKETERSPVFVQFLDVVHQLMLAYPRSFEFNEWLLLSIIDAMHTNGHSPFRFNNEKQSCACAGCRLHFVCRPAAACATQWVVSPPPLTGGYRLRRSCAGVWRTQTKPAKRARLSSTGPCSMAMRARSS